ncbi:MAG: hybrid sensor histidine kinase/response regulator [Actinobacteria bacterium]|nr:hybrid sensor histidine kinase/response regulator [Actinomycetota bacterium]
MTRVRTLLVDDAVDLRILIRRALEASGRYEVVGEAGDGVEAIAQAESLVPELVLLDLSMPRMDGLEALPRLHAVSPASTVVVLSGHTRELAEASALAAGAVAYLEKGLRPTQLVVALDAARGIGPRAIDGGTVARPPIEPPETATLLSELAHDLRSEIVKATGFLTLTRHRLTDDHPAALSAERAAAAVDRLARLLEGALAYTRAGVDSLVVRPLALREAVDDLLTGLVDDVDDAHERITVEVDAEADALADPVALDRVLRNLAANALRYGDGLPVTVRVSLDGDRARLDVLDRGPGFTDDDLAVLFRPFARGTAGATTGGTGLGLAVAARLVQLMGGGISAARRPDGGARVTVHLPRATPPAAS